VRPTSSLILSVGNILICADGPHPRKPCYQLDIIFHEGYIPSVAWEVEFTNEFGGLWNSLTIEEQEEINAKVELLEEHGPTLPRPHSDVIVTSRHANMKELRGRAGDAHLRVLYAFNPRRTAILLIGGDKTGKPGWYEEFVPRADTLLDKHLEELKKEERGGT
jgi:hypothetical protein